jgi:hypothetical protein
MKTNIEHEHAANIKTAFDNFTTAVTAAFLNRALVPAKGNEHAPALADMNTALQKLTMANQAARLDSRRHSRQ